MPGAGNWPNQADYTLALQNPLVCFSDGELSRCQLMRRSEWSPHDVSGKLCRCVPGVAGRH